MDLFKTSDLDAWAFVSEQNIFLQDGLQHLADTILAPPKTVPSLSFVDVEQEFGASCAELGKRLLATCSLQHGLYYRFFKYRQSALTGLWLAQKQRRKRSEKDRNSKEEVKKLEQGQSEICRGGEVPFSSHVSLLLLLPLLQSQSKTDPALADHCVGILLQCLRDCQPYSLSCEPQNCIKGLQSLLCNWLQGDGSSVERESAITCLVALGCGTFSIKVFIQALQVLVREQKEKLRPLPVGDIVRKAVQYERTGQYASPTFILTSLHAASWKFQDSDISFNSPEHLNKCHSLACDGRFLYLTNFLGKGILKLGSGKHGTLRGFPYNRNFDLDDGWVACVEDVLLFRPQEFDKHLDSLCMVLDPQSLKLLQTLSVSAAEGAGMIDDVQRGDGQNGHAAGPRTVQFMSDGTHLYWLWCDDKLVIPQEEQGVAQQKPYFNLYLQEFQLVHNHGSLSVSCGVPVVVTKKEEETVPQGVASPLGRRSPTTTAPRESEEMTSSSLSLSTLHQTAMFVNSDSLVMVLPHHLVPSLAPPLRTARSPVNFCFSTLDGSYIGQENVVDTTPGPWRDLIVMGLGACYDSLNDMLWTCGNNLVSEWSSLGYPSYSRVRSQLGVDSTMTGRSGDETSAAQVQLSVTEQIAFLCRTLESTFQTMHDTRQDPDTVLDTSYLKLICDVIETAIKNSDHSTLLCLLIALQPLLKLASSRATPLTEDVVKQTRSLAWKLVCAHTDVIGAQIQREACDVLLSGRSVFYPSLVEQSALVTVLLSETDATTGLVVFRNQLLSELASELTRPSLSGGIGFRNGRLAEDTVFSLVKLSVKETRQMLAHCNSAQNGGDQKPMETCSIVPSTLQYLSALVTTTWKDLMLTNDYMASGSAEEVCGSIEKLVEIQVLSCKVMEGCQEILQVLLEMLGKLSSDSEQSENVEFRLGILERCVLTSMLGQLLPVIVTVLDGDKFCHIPVAKSLLPTVTSLTVMATKVVHLYLRLKCQSKGDQQAEDSKGNTEDLISILPIPRPWSSPRTVESIHPVRDDYKLSRTVKLPGATCLYLRFDPRCATQYEYDKVIVYSGSTSGRKVAEYGGNSHGIGGRGVVRLGWPKDVIKVDSDTVTISFQVKSTRERGTPDKAVWGFACIVSATDTAESPSELPVLVDVALGLSVLTHSFMNVMYRGPLTTVEEQSCHQLLKSKLLQRCVWPTKADVSVPSSACGIKFTITSELARRGSTLDEEHPQKNATGRNKLDRETVQSLREMACSIAPTLRPSIREAIKPEEIEEVVLSAVVKHLGLADLIQNLPLLQAKEEENEDYLYLCAVMQEAFRRLNALIRQLQAMADLEQQWSREVEDISLGGLQPSAAFFNEYHLQESKTKDLELLCNLHGVEFDPVEQEEAVGKLIQRLEEDSKQEKTKDGDVSAVLPVTQAFLFSIIECGELLCNVTMKSRLSKGRPERSVSHGAFASSVVQGAETDAGRENDRPSSPGFMRSMSAPPQLQRSLEAVQEGIQDVLRLQRWRTAVQRKSVLGVPDEKDGSSDNKETFFSTLDEIFTFIGSDPEKTVSCSQFLAAATVRNERGAYRVQSLQRMRELVAECSGVGGLVPHLLAVVASIIVQGTRTDELECGGLVSEVRDEFSSVVQTVVQFAATDPTVYSDSVLAVSVCPFMWHEERCVVRCGLLSMLDQLCALRRSRTQQGKKLALRAWAGFQVLINRCVQWEQEKGYRAGDIEWSGLAYQVSTLLTNYLNCVLEESRRNHSRISDPLRYILDLLSSIAKSKMREAILSEPCTVSTLLALLMDRHASPRLILTVLKLLRTALPLMSADSCQGVSLPTAANQILGSDSRHHQHLRPVVKVAKLLLAKLGDYILPSAESDSVSVSEEDISTKSGEKPQDGESNDGQDDVVSVNVHLQENQQAHEVVQKIFSSNGAPFIFVIGQGSDMEHAVRIDQELTERGHAEVLTDRLPACVRRAHKLAQSGIVVSIGPTGQLAEDDDDEGSSQGKQQDPHSLCKLRNTKLTRTNASRPFICGQAAQTMASEVIALVHSLLSTVSSDTSKMWTSALYQVLCDALKYVPNLVGAMEDEIESTCVDKQPEDVTEAEEEGTGLEMDDWLPMARHVVAALCVLGGFRQRLRPGCIATVVGEGVAPMTAEVLSVSDRQGVATVLLRNGSEKYSERVQDIPLVRLRIQDNQMLPLCDSLMVDSVVDALHHLISVRDPPIQPSVQPSAAARVLAEVKSRASMVVLCLVKDPLFLKTLTNEPAKLLPVLRELGAECDPGERLSVNEAHCDELRMLFKEFVKPLEQANRRTKPRKMVLDLYRAFPPVRGCVFTEGQMCVYFMAEPAPPARNTALNLPRGTFVYANLSVPIKAPSFYWEIELLSLCTVEEHVSGPTLSVGFAPGAQPNPGGSGWVNPIGTCFLHSNGRAVHYRSGGLLQWKTVSLNITMKEMDVVGCGYERVASAGTPFEDTDKGKVYFTYNGTRLCESLDGIEAGLWPALHIQQKERLNVRVRVNFGSRPFAYAAGHRHRAAAELVSDSAEELRSVFEMMPFAFEFEDEEAESSSVAAPSPPSGNVSGNLSHASLAPTASSQESSNEDYSSMASLQYKLSSSYDRMTDTGPVRQLMVDTRDSSVMAEQASQDPLKLLVKAWEERVFPVIRRRFRNDADRRSGLEQIRGALMAGMMDIAVATVGDLYDDNGGIPPTLQLPKLEDVKADAKKMTMANVRKGMTIVINSFSLQDSLPGFAVAEMRKTFGLVGIVQGIDRAQELVEVETYNREEGSLLRYWYPVSAVERPSSTPGFRRAISVVSSVDDAVKQDVLVELLKCEASACRMYCRLATTELMSRQGAADELLIKGCDLIQYLASNVLVGPQSEGDILQTSSQSSPSPRHCLKLNTLQPSNLFFRDPEHLRDAIRHALFMAANEGEEDVTNLIDTHCHVLKDPGLAVVRQELPLNVSKVDSHVHFQNAAMTVVSFKENVNNLTTGGGSNVTKNASVSLYCYYGGNKLTKSGQLARYKVVSYPSTDQVAGSTAETYPQKILPCNRLYIRSEVPLTENLSVLLHGFPPEFFLCLAFVEVFIVYFLEGLKHQKRVPQSVKRKGLTGKKNSIGQASVTGAPNGSNIEGKKLSRTRTISSSRARITQTSLFHLTDLLSEFLQKADLPSVIKEIIFHLLAELLRASMLPETQKGIISRCRSPSEPFARVLKRLSPLCAELPKVLEKEVSVTNTTALNFVLNCNFEKDKFTSYLQALLELVLAMAEHSHCASLARVGQQLRFLEDETKDREDDEPCADDASQVDSSGSQPEASGDVSNVTSLTDISIGEELPAGPVVFTAPPIALHQAQFSRRQRMRNRRSGSGRRKKPNLTTNIPSPTESMPWFEEVLNTTMILRNILYGDREGASQAKEVLSSVVSAKSNVFQRILIVTNIPKRLERKAAIHALRKACRPSGGIFEEGLYLPEVPREKVSGLTQECVTSVTQNCVTTGTHTAEGQHPEEKALTTPVWYQPERIMGYAVLELRSGHQVELARQAIMASKALNIKPGPAHPTPTHLAGASDLGVAKVNSELLVEGTNELEAFGVLDNFLKNKLFLGDTEKHLTAAAEKALVEIFMSCVLTSTHHSKSTGETSSSEKLQTVNETSVCSTTANGSDDKETPVHDSKEGYKRTIPETQTSVRLAASTDSANSKDTDFKLQEGVCKENPQTGPSACVVTKDQIFAISHGNNLLKFFNFVRNAKESAFELVSQLARVAADQESAGSNPEDSEETFSLKAFLDWVLRRGVQDVRCVWKGLLTCGYNIRFERCTLLFPWEVEQDHAKWTVERDSALVQYVDTLCHSLSTSPFCLVPDEVNIEDSDLANQLFVPLQGIPMLSIRTRFAFLKALNQTLERLVLPVTDLRLSSPYYLSTAALLKDASCLMFYDTKIGFLNHVLDNSAHRGSEQSSPEISLDPLETLEANKVSSAGPQFCQAARQLSSISSRGLRVKVATGGDPVFPLKVHLRGEQVLGSGGSFRHFMWHMARELQGPHVGLLITCPSSAANKNKGKFILKPGPMTYPEEKLLIFFGQLLGIALRSDIPLALDLMPVFWKSLLEIPLDPHTDLQETDILTYNYIRRFSQVATREEFSTLCYEADLCPYKFVYTSVGGQEVELVPDGANTSVTWENHGAYVKAIRDFRLRELRSESRMSCIRCGLSSVIPLPQALCVMRPTDMEIRTCALPTLDLDFLKAHTTYVAGVKDTDPHIEYFWTAMESFSQDQLKKFVKFACNQERLPSRCTCQENANMIDVHVPPYPMKIGPPDGRGPSDARYIRVETCMFMVKLPQYSSQETMSQRLLYAINCREDPLTDR